jgi:large subunit ribosomal protein L14e
MVVFEVGRIALKVAGREAGRYCCVLKKIDDNFVLVTGPKPLTGVKRRRANIDHLEATPYKLEIKEEATDRAVITAYEKAGLITKLGLKKPPAVALKPPKKPKKPKKPPKIKKPPKPAKVKKPKVKKPMVKKPMVKKPMVKKPMVKKPMVKKPMVKKAKKPRAKKPQKRAKK